MNSEKPRLSRSGLRIRLLLSAGLGLVAGGLSAALWSAGAIHHVLAGWVVASATFTVPLVVLLMHAPAADAATDVEKLGQAHLTTELVTLGAAIASLAGVALMLFTTGTSRMSEAVLSVATVISGWALVHTVYAIRYARHFFNAEPGCVDFNTDSPPRLSDFAYLSFTLGMTYQVSDTAIHTTALRRIVLGHTLLSYLFGTGVIAVTINLVAGLAQ